MFYFCQKLNYQAQELLMKFFIFDVFPKHVIINVSRKIFNLGKSFDLKACNQICWWWFNLLLLFNHVFVSSLSVFLTHQHRTYIHRHTQTYTDIHRHTQTYTDIHRNTQTYTDIHKHPRHPQTSTDIQRHAQKNQTLHWHSQTKNIHRHTWI